MILNLILKRKSFSLGGFVVGIELDDVSWLHLTLIRLFQIYLSKKFFSFFVFCYLVLFACCGKSPFPKCIHWNKNKLSIAFQHKNTLSHILVERNMQWQSFFWRRRSRVVAEVASNERVCEVNNKGKPHLIHKNIHEVYIETIKRRVGLFTLFKVVTEFFIHCCIGKVILLFEELLRPWFLLKGMSA